MAPQSTQWPPPPYPLGPAPEAPSSTSLMAMCSWSGTALARAFTCSWSTPMKAFPVSFAARFAMPLGPEVELTDRCRVQGAGYRV